MNLKEKLKFRDDERGVSPVIGVIMMIAIVVIIAAVVAAFAYGIIGGVSKAPSAALVMEGTNPGSTSLKVIHHGGDSIIEAFKHNSSHATTGAGDWSRLDVRKNGASVSLVNSSLNNDKGWNPAASTPYTAFEAGDELLLVFTVTEKLETGDSLAIIYTETGDILQRTSVT